ncbi:unnamed protein product [Medioppia subpectinata]|uniref:Uncharacterized protein n=1 Tax=Medioppia subpectinata TaxID=1979941 RepID=A0A7R9LPT4_9ACAR|nr:unnamed protein product [Medioppia subpectinata]CAG2120335.1 unnamed protein product [Medioppia subpectinata]
MKAVALIVFGLIACASAGILSPYVGYSGYYAAPTVVSRTYTSHPVVSRAYAAPYVSSYVSPYVSSPYVSSYVSSPYVRSYVSAPYVAAPVAYSSGYSYSPYAAYNYLLKK